MRVVQYSVDIMVRNEHENELDFAFIITEALEKMGFEVCGADFSVDVTRDYL